MTEDIKSLEKEAHRLLDEKEFSQAAELFHRVAESHREGARHQQAALCFALAASCWALKAGEKTFYNAARMYEKAAREAEDAQNFEYASLLHKHAAVCFERDLEYLGFSECFYRSKECYRKFLKSSLFSRHKPQGEAGESSLRNSARQFISWCLLTFSWMLWGHGERPQRTLIFGCLLILGYAFIYTLGLVETSREVTRPSWFQAVYLSVITFTTVGYGDIVPLGLNRVFAILEALSGLCVAPVFITGLCRKYLRF